MEANLLQMKYIELRSKVTEMCLKEKLEFTFMEFKFPVIATVKYDNEDKDQVVMSDNLRPEPRTGSLTFIFGDDLEIKTDENFRISDEFFNRLKNNIKKLHYAYLQAYLKNSMGMIWNEDESND
ncbi:MAG: hypothetical protein GXZ11_05745 [Tissierellia bacterium]|nr:hypothetical protein [Tissierellia bacterium]